MQQEEQNQGFNIELPEAVADGIYSNLAIVGQGAEEFVIDFVRLTPGRQSAKVHSRVIMNPANIKRLTRLLQQHIYAYEQNFGTINLPEEQEQEEGHLPSGEA